MNEYDVLVWGAIIWVLLIGGLILYLFILKPPIEEVFVREEQ